MNLFREVSKNVIYAVRAADNGIAATPTEFADLVTDTTDAILAALSPEIASQVKPSTLDVTIGAALDELKLGHKLGAIKAVRDCAGVSLSEAKHAVDLLDEALKDATMVPKPKPLEVGDKVIPFRCAETGSGDGPGMVEEMYPLIGEVGTIAHLRVGGEETRVRVEHGPISWIWHIDDLKRAA